MVQPWNGLLPQDVSCIPKSVHMMARRLGLLLHCSTDRVHNRCSPIPFAGICEKRKEKSTTQSVMTGASVPRRAQVGTGESADCGTPCDINIQRLKESWGMYTSETTLLSCEGRFGLFCMTQRPLQQSFEQCCSCQACRSTDHTKVPRTGDFGKTELALHTPSSLQC